MKRGTLSSLLALLWIAALATGAPSTRPSTQPATAPAQPWSRYEVVVDRNIFMRRARGNDGRSRPSGPVIPESGRAWVLSGTALLANDRVAFLENTGTGATTRFHEGDATAAGKIVHIDSDHLDLNVDGQVVSVSIGSTLDGKPHDASATQPATEPADTAAAASSTESSTPLPPPANSIEAAMRARREQELSHH